MAIDLKTLRKVDSGPPSRQIVARDEKERFVIIVKLHEGAELPAYVLVRSMISAQLFTGEVSGADLTRLETDPAVQSVALSRPLAIIE
jgi:hypothetical protein